MNTFIKTSPFLILAIILISCKAQDKTESPIEVKTEQNIGTSEFDPSFVESTEIYLPHGPTSISRNHIQDKNGDYWFATFLGIIHYDGRTFTNITNQKRLRRFRAFSVLEDKAGNIWFGTIGAGVYKYDGKSFINFTTKDGLVNNDVGCIYEDNEGIIWFGTRVGMSRYDGIMFMNYTTDNGLIDNDINSIIEDKSGKYWIGARGEACTYDGKTFTKIINDADEPFVNVRCIIKDKEDNMWLGGRDGLWRYDGESFKNIATNFTGHIYEDRDRNIWTSSQAKDNTYEWIISKYDYKSLKSNTNKAEQLLKQENMFFGIMQDKKSDLWFGSLRGVSRYDGNTFDFFNDN